jgi:hypothetical protein
LFLFICYPGATYGRVRQITGAGGRTQIKRGAPVDPTENLFYKGRKEGKGASE